MNTGTEPTSTEHLIAAVSQLINVLQVKHTQAPPAELEHYSIEEVAGILHCGTNSVRNIIKANEIKVFRYKGLMRIRKIHLERFISKNSI